VGTTGDKGKTWQRRKKGSRGEVIILKESMISVQCKQPLKKKKEVEDGVESPHLSP